jgi:hypothetical protein
MTAISSIVEVVSESVPWNKGKIVGARPPHFARSSGQVRTDRGNATSRRRLSERDRQEARGLICSVVGADPTAV